MTAPRRLHVLASFALIGGVLFGCSPREVADAAVERAARTVITPVVDDLVTGMQAQAATDCILANASPEEKQALARDVGTIAGTTTRARVAAIVARPETQTCLNAAGVPPLGL
ncbi:MAG: hypothetical protein R3D84_14795 [Paracoccaceae bacterium]